MEGPVCTALAPVPIIATRLPLRSTDPSQRAVWNIGPRKSSSPGIGGMEGWLSWPTAVTRALQVRRSSAPAAQRHGPVRRGLVETRLGHLDIEADVPADVVLVEGILDIAVDLRPLGEMA